jgi:hypothetical protein
VPSRCARIRWSLAAALAATLPGCYTGIEPNAQDGGEGDGDGGSDGSDGDAPDAEEAALLIPARVRRLSAAEYRATVAALLGDDTLAASLPPDPMINGYANKADVLRVTSPMAQALWAATPQMAQQLANDLLAASPCSGDERGCAGQILQDVALKAYRRPIAEDELAELLDVYDLGRQDADLAAGLALALRVVLQSPDLLYRTELGNSDDDSAAAIELTQHEVAAAISYACTGAPPDAELLQLAADRSLGDPEIRVEQARRLLAGPLAANVIADFADQWLEAPDVAAVDRDPALYPEWMATRQSAAAELHAFMATAILEEGFGYADLLLADWTVVDETLAAFYGAAGPGRITRPEGRRAGVLSLVGFLATHAQFQDPSPVQRGHFVRTRLLCQSMPPPPNDVVVAPPPPDPTLSNRERWFQKTDNESCSGCHDLMDPLGYAFENFDAVGQWRAMDAGAPVDASGRLTASDVDADFMDLEGLAGHLAQSQIGRRCFAGHWLEYSLGKSFSEEEMAVVADAVDPFLADESTIDDMIVAIVASDAFVWRGPMLAQ